MERREFLQLFELFYNFHSCFCNLIETKKMLIYCFFSKTLQNERRTIAAHSAKQTEQTCSFKSTHFSQRPHFVLHDVAMDAKSVPQPNHCGLASFLKSST